MLKPNTATAGLTPIDRNRLGDLAERWVTLLASWKGCEVFENIGCTGKTDIVLVHPTLGTLAVDVKCSLWRKDENRWIRQGSRVKDPNIWAVEVTPEGDIANWKISWGRNQVPAGWENFWSIDNRYYQTK